MRHDQDKLKDILEAIDAIVSKAGKDRDAFDADPMLRVWCLYHITIIGEAAARLSDELREKYPAPPWREIISTRNTLVHAYFGIDWNEVWNVVKKDLDLLKSNIQNILDQEGW